MLDKRGGLVSQSSIEIVIQDNNDENAATSSEYIGEVSSHL